MILLRIIMKSLPEKQKEIWQTLLSLLRSPGQITESKFISQGIFCDIENQNVFNLISEWATRQDVNQYISSDRFSVLLGTRSLLSEPLNIQIITVSDFEGAEVVDFIRGKRK